MTANWFIASFQCLTGRPQSAVILRGSQPDQLAGRVVAGEMPAGLDDLADLGVDAFDRIGRVDHPADLRRKGEERDHPVPRPAPSSDHDGEFPAPCALLELVQGRLGSLRADGAID